MILYVVHQVRHLLLYLYTLHYNLSHFIDLESVLIHGPYHEVLLRMGLLGLLPCFHLLSCSHFLFYPLFKLCLIAVLPVRPRLRLVLGPCLFDVGWLPLLLLLTLQGYCLDSLLELSLYCRFQLIFQVALL